jgi:uncharacterized membrane protein
MKLPDQKNVYLVISAVAAIFVLIGAVVQINLMLKSVGVNTINEAVSLDSQDKVNFALYLTITGASFATVIWAGGSLLKDNVRSGGVLFGVSAVLALTALLLPLIQNYPISTLGYVILFIGLCTTGYLGYDAISTPITGLLEREPYMDSREIAIVAVFSALTAVLTGTSGLMLPSPTGGYTHIGDTAIYVAALLFGAKVGGLVGVIGPVAADILVGYPRWFVTVLAHGSQGYIAGFGKGRGIVSQIILLTISGIVMSTSYFFVNIFIKGYPIALISFARDLFGQSLVSIILGLILSKAVEKALPSRLR